MQNWLILIIIIGIIKVEGYYSKTYKKCRLFNENKIDLSELELEIISQYKTNYHFLQLTNTTLPLNYQALNLLYDQYIDAGGSGEVYRVEDIDTNKIKILKRFFQENILEFQQENYAMHQMNYQVQWHKQDNDANKSTLASYPSKQSVVLKNLQLETENQIAVLFFKICREIAKAHHKGIIHNDLKMGNIVIHSIGEGLRTIDVQLIDWNLATFYYKGYQSQQKKGTPCYYAPQAILRTSFITPAIDIWSLAVVYFTFINDKKPFPLNCKKNNLQAIISLVGSDKFQKFYRKYHIVNGIELDLIKNIIQKKIIYKGISIRDRIPQQYQKIFNDQLIDLFQKMLEIDPQYRITIDEVLNHPYFDRIKKLPQKYKEKNKNIKAKKLHYAYQQISGKQVPANNLIKAQKPTITEQIQQQQTNNSTMVIK